MTDFRGDLEGYLAWAEKDWAWNPSFCPEHWAPAPVEGKNGLMASVLVMQAAIETMPADVADPKNPSGMNSWLANQRTPTCCRLGDERMAQIWAQC